MSTLKKFAAIEINSGFIWGVARAKSAEEACMAVEADADGTREVYGFKRINKAEASTSDGGFAVYEVGDGFEVENGQSAVEIANLAASFPLVGYFRSAA